jgi:hypothetical protein
MAEPTLPHEVPIQQSQSQTHATPSNAPESGALLPTKNYDMFYTTSRLNVKLHLGSGSSSPIAYYAQSSILTTKPRMFLRLGDSKSSPMVALGQMSFTSCNMLLASGDSEYGDESKLVWEDLHRMQNILHRGDYEFCTAAGGRGRVTYTWRRERAVMSGTRYECVDEKGAVVACMYSGGFFNWRKGGEIKVQEGLEKPLEELLIISALGIWVFEAGGSMYKTY